MKNIYILKLLIILLLFIILYFICKNKKFFIETYNNSKTLYFCSHLGLGDNITNIGATRFLLQYYDTIYFFCKQQYKSNVQLLFIDEPRIIIYDVDEVKLGAVQARNLAHIESVFRAPEDTVVVDGQFEDI